jgi:type IV pilus assembly protein PilW
MTAMNKPNRTLHRRARISGVSLIELLVAVTIGGLLIFGATKVYVDSRATYEVNETAARLQETARYALSVMEPDLRMANYLGLMKGGHMVNGKVAQTAAATGVAQTCGTNFAQDIETSLEASENGYTLACGAFGAGAVGSSDTITVRRAAMALSSGGATGRLRVCSTRVDVWLVTDTASVTGCSGAGSQINDLVVNTYYIDRDSTQRAGLPALRRRPLGTDGLAPAFLPDEEIIAGVEDMQVQFGVDLDPIDGTAQRYINPSGLGALSDLDQIVAVRIWLLVRAENPEVGFRDNRTYEYGDRTTATGTTTDLNAANADGRAYAPGDGFRRLLVSRTIQIRNAMGT